MARTTKRVKAEKLFNVTLARIGQEAQIHQLTPGQTVKDLLDKAGFNGDVRDVRVDAAVVETDYKLKANQVITVVPRVQGG